MLTLVLLLSGCTSSPAPEEHRLAAPVMVAVIPETSSSSAETAPGALVDGEDPTAGTGGEWEASADDAAPWARLSWVQEQRIATVQVHGPTEAAFDPQRSTAAALNGVLRFSDGSSVVVSGISGGGGMPTTVAFTPRQVTWVQLNLFRTVSDAVIGLREMRAYGDSELAPVVRGGAEGLVAPGPEPTCPDDSAAPAAGAGLQLSCPAPGSTVSGDAQIVVLAPPGARLSAWAYKPPVEGSSVGTIRPVAVGRAGDDGRVLLSVDMSGLPSGPLTIKVVRDDGARSDANTLHVQLNNSVGVAIDQVSGPPGDMGLRFEDDFDGALSATVTGDDALYATLKPEPWGGSQFGDALFANPEWGADTVATTDGHLRLRVQPIGGLADRATWGQQHLGGLLSSQRFGGSGFSAQYGYFEARVLGAPGPGAWSAFWAMNTESGTGRAGGASGELDAVEFYGHDTANTCHAVHSWGEQEKTGVLECIDVVRPPDWALVWHTYGALVEPGGAKFFIDGVQVADFDELSHTEEPFFFMFDATLGGGWPIDLAGSGDVTDMYVDWVRVYT